MTTKVSLAIHPGEHIADELEARGMTAAELWMRLQGDYDLALAREARVA